MKRKETKRNKEGKNEPTTQQNECANILVSSTRTHTAAHPSIETHTHTTATNTFQIHANTEYPTTKQFIMEKTKWKLVQTVVEIISNDLCYV